MVLSPPAPALEVPSLEQAYEDCRVETERWAKTFYLGTLLMPPAKRRAIWAIYVWCRRTDELMDSPEAQALPEAQLRDRLDHWEARTRELFAGQVRDGLDRVMADVIERYPQPLEPYIEMIEAYAVLGQVIDQTQQAMKSGNKRRYVQNLAANVAINTNRFEKRRVVSEAIKIARARYIDAKLVLFPAGAGVLVGLRIDVGVHPDIDTAGCAQACCAFRDALQLRFRLDRKRQDVFPQCQLDFLHGLSDTGKDHLTGRNAGGPRPDDFTT